MPDQPQTVEPVPVQLTRIEGVVNLIAYQMTEVKADVGEVRASVADLAVRVSAVELAQAAAAEIKKTDANLAARVSAVEHAITAAGGASAFVKAWLPVILTALGVAVALGFGIKFGN